MFEFSEMQQLVKLFNSEKQNSDSEEENQNEPGTSFLRPKKSHSSRVTSSPQAQKINPYAKIQTDDLEKTKRREILDSESEEKFLEEEEEKAQTDWKKAPEWDICYKQQVTPSDVFLQMGMKNPTTASCEDMIVTVQLPGESRQNMDLKIKQERLTLITPRFYLNLPLPHPVDPQKGNAQFDDDAGKLVITLRMAREFDVVNF